MASMAPSISASDGVSPSAPDPRNATTNKFFGNFFPGFFVYFEVESDNIG